MAERPILYHACDSDLEVGAALPALTEPSHFIQRRAREGHTWLEDAIDAARSGDAHSRRNARFAFDDPALCAAHFESERNRRAAQGGSVGDLHLYRVEFPDGYTRAPVALVNLCRFSRRGVDRARAHHRRVLEPDPRVHDLGVPRRPYADRRYDRYSGTLRDPTRCDGAGERDHCHTAGLVRGHSTSLLTWSQFERTGDAINDLSVSVTNAPFAIHGRISSADS